LKNDYTIRSIERALKLLKSYTNSKNEFTLKEMADTLKLNKSTVFRIIMTLEKEEFIEVDSDNRYKLGHEILFLASIIKDNTNIRKEAYSFMKKLGKETGETVILAVFQNYKVICIEKIESFQTVKITSQIGATIPLFEGATGKALAAFISEENFDRYIAVQSKLYGTEYDQSSLALELEKIKNDKFIITHGEVDERLAAVAVPIFDFSGGVVASLSIASPEFRFSKEREIVLKNILIEISHELSKILGFQLKKDEPSTPKIPKVK
jgi:IclR family transcriptional regulator, KDG regulon repressor